ncbi:MAG: hypothetical protein IK061_00155, partial [Desulfovibrio sp.]|nr:hypothetical protein [Desulfovibrio sp.]
RDVRQAARGSRRGLACRQAPVAAGVAGQPLPDIKHNFKILAGHGLLTARQLVAHGKNSWQKRRNFEKKSDIKQGIAQAPDSSTILEQGAFAVSARTTGRNFFRLPS